MIPKINSKNVWEIYAPVFAKITPAIARDILTYAAHRASGDVLDVGTGTGKLFEQLHPNRLVSRCVGIDSNLEMVELAKKTVERIGDKRFSVEHSTIEAVQTKYDCITSINVLYAVDDPVKFLRKAHIQLRTGGRLILSTPGLGIDMYALEKHVDAEFTRESAFYEDYLIFKECNHFLVSRGFEPRLFSANELITILIATGFKIADVCTSHNLGGNITVEAHK